MESNTLLVAVTEASHSHSITKLMSLPCITNPQVEVAVRRAVSNSGRACRRSAYDLI